jgi:hypothetical protein
MFQMGQSVHERRCGKFGHVVPPKAKQSMSCSARGQCGLMGLLWVLPTKSR